VSAAEHGMNASTFTARVIASTGADVAADLRRGRRHERPPARRRPEPGAAHDRGVERSGDARGYVKGVLDRGERLMGFGHRVYRAEDPRARVLRATCKRLDAPRYEVALALEQAPRSPSCASVTPTGCWRPTSSSGPRSCSTSPRCPRDVHADVHLRAHRWLVGAHILEQKKTGRLIRPSARYVGPAPRRPEDVPG
jgi:citrate synthase